MGACLWAPGVQRAWGTSFAHTPGLVPSTTPSQARVSPASWLARTSAQTTYVAALRLSYQERSASFPSSGSQLPLGSVMVSALRVNLANGLRAQPLASTSAQGPHCLPSHPSVLSSPASVCETGSLLRGLGHAHTRGSGGGDGHPQGDGLSHGAPDTRCALCSTGSCRWAAGSAP